MNVLKVEIDTLENGNYQVVERTRSVDGKVVNEVRYEESTTIAGAEKMRLGGEQSLAKFRRPTRRYAGSTWKLLCPEGQENHDAIFLAGWLYCFNILRKAPQ